MKLIPTGIENFKEMIDKNAYYVDKTNLIIDVLNEQVVFCTRPRRFGKTLNMSMLYYFFSIKEKDNAYELVVDLPGFTKDEIKASVENGYLTISAAKGLDEDDKDKETGKYIRRERYTGSCQRSFYVGEDVTEEDIKAEFKHGILKLFVPKKEAKPAVEQKKYVSIEG